MKLIIQMPCYNEEGALAATLATLPTSMDGIDVIETLIIDDGSTDRTVEVARAGNVDHIIRNTHNLGLARTFAAGIDAALARGADIIVNLDADTQHDGADIPALVAPVLAGEADVAVGDRQIMSSAHYSWLKSQLERFGSYVVRRFSGTDVADAVCGFRAISRNAAQQLNIVSDFSYTIEMLIQCGRLKLKVVSVPIRSNPPSRDSRLARSIAHFIRNSVQTILRIYTMYYPLKVFATIGIILLTIGALPFIRLTYHFFIGVVSGHLPSLVFGAVLVILGFLTLMFGIIADLISYNRQLVERTLLRVRQLEDGRTDDNGKARAPKDVKLRESA